MAPLNGEEEGFVDPVLQFDDPRLRRKSEPVTEAEFNSDIMQQWIERMKKALKAHGGIGIAAPQIGILKRIVVIDIPRYERVGFGIVDASPFHVLVNPEIVWYSDEQMKATEGCLSVKGYEGFVTRPKNIRVVAYTPQGERREFEATSLYSRCIQHELDHLDGILYVDRVRELRDIRKVVPVQEVDPVLAFNPNFNKPFVVNNNNNNNNNNQ